MDSISGSQASTYYSQAERENTQLNYRTPLRRSQRLREKSMTPTSQRSNASKSVSPFKSSQESLRRRNSNNRSPPLFPAFVSESQQNVVSTKPDATTNAYYMAAMEAALSTKALTASKKTPNRKTRKPVKRLEPKPKTVSARTTRGRPRGRQSKPRSQALKDSANRVASAKSVRKQSKTTANDVDTKLVNPNFATSFSNDVLNAKRERPIERYYVRPSALGPTPGNLSILPAQYPQHFIHQLPPDNHNIMTNDHHDHLVDEMQAEFQRVLHEKELDDYYRRKREAEPEQEHEGQPDSSIEDLDTMSIDDISDDLSDLSLSGSMLEIFGTKSLRSVLELQPIHYRFTEEHVTAIALILNVELPRLRSVMTVVQKLPPGEIVSMAAELVGVRNFKRFDLQADNAEDAECSELQVARIQDSRSQHRHFPDQRQSKE